MVTVTEKAAGVSAEDVQRVMRGCTAEEFVGAAKANPDFLGGVDPEVYRKNQCEHVPDMQDYGICK